MWQVQIYVDQVGEWYGWAHCKLQSSKKLAQRQAKTAQRYGWKTRVVKVKEGINGR